MTWLLGTVWAWLLLAVLVGVAVTLLACLRKVTVSSIRVGTLEVADVLGTDEGDLDDIDER